jgi:hypothetical protein
MTEFNVHAYPKTSISPIFSKIIVNESKAGAGKIPKFIPMPPDQQVKVINKLIDHLKSSK